MTTRNSIPTAEFVKASLQDLRIYFEAGNEGDEIGREQLALIAALLPWGYLAQDEVAFLLDSENEKLAALGERLLDAFPAPQDSHIEQILAEMAQQGKDFNEFNLGTCLAARLDQNSAYYPRVCAVFAVGNKNLQYALLQAFYSVQRPLALIAQQLILNCAGQANEDDELLNLATIALAKCHQLKAQATQILTQLLDSPHWFVRGNASQSLAKLGISDITLILRIGVLIFDGTGNDWSVQSASLAAITELGAAARPVLPQLLRLAAMSLMEEDYTGWPCTNHLLTEAFAAIGDDSPAVIAALQNIVAKKGYVSARPAVYALGRLGSAALPALDTICDYLSEREHQPADTEVATRLLQAILAIGGSEDGRLGQVVRYFECSPFDEVREVSKQWAWAR